MSYLIDVYILLYCAFDLSFHCLLKGRIWCRIKIESTEFKFGEATASTVFLIPRRTGLMKQGSDEK